MKLWQKETTDISQLIEQFTIGKDKGFDLLLAKYDIEGSIAHVKMLASIGLISKNEEGLILDGLKEIGENVDKGNFKIENNVEDVHSQIEFLLTEKIGDAGKKIHSGRSRNDQVAVDIKLYLKAQLIEIKNVTIDLFNLLIAQSNKYKGILLPGYTHLQIAMPSSFGLWFGAYAESFVDDMEMLASAYIICNKNPLGSGAGYGSSFPLNRMQTTTLLNFAGLNYNSVYAQMTRGKTEKVTSMALSCIAATLSKFAMDCCLYLNQNFGFISFPSDLTTGSSIMPHKKNPDVFELIRAKCNRIQSVPNELTLLINNLPSGYHRDLQLTKEILFPAISELKECIHLTGFMISNIEINKNILDNDLYKYIFSVEAVNELVNKGIPFRDAYVEIGNQIEKGEFKYNHQKGLSHTHEGSIGNLNNDDIVNTMNMVDKKFK